MSIFNIFLFIYALIQVMVIMFQWHPDSLKVVLVQDWLQEHGPFDAVVDGANIGLINNHSFNFTQVSG